MATSNAVRTLSASKNPTSKKSQTSASARSFRRSADLFKMVGDPTRLRVIAALALGEKNVTELCEGCEHSQPAVSHHLSILRHGRIIEPRRDGKSNYYSLTPTGRVLAQTAERLVEGLE